MVRIVWDEPKRRANLIKHAMDFADLDLSFFQRAQIDRAKNGRSIAVGWLDGMTAVVFVTLGSEALSVISMRRASARERKDYDEVV